MDRKLLGWNSFFEAAFSPFSGKGWAAARVAAEDKHAYVVLTEHGDLTATVAGRLLHQKRSNADLPKVGDWVALELFPGKSPPLIQAVLPRRTKLARKVPGREVEEQVLAANIDAAFVVQALDQTFNLRRQERFLVMVHEGGARAVVVLNKADLCDCGENRLREAQAGAGSSPVLLASAVTRQGLQQLRGYIQTGETVVFIGPSGVGKSSLINSLYGEEIQATLEVREQDGKGRHSTTWRELILLPGGGLVIDTPGMREVQMGMVGGGLHDAFPEVQELALGCHFRDCSHTVEKRCAVQEALANDRLSPERYASFLKLKKELDYLAEERQRHTYLARKRQSKIARRTFEKIKPHPYSLPGEPAP
jgi:ribosome biogenesis GTPase / thiamine phosphate phosphatase